jgi:hypothetical protein
MNLDYGEDLGSDEERRIESEDLHNDDVSDLFDKTEEVRRPKEPGGQLENPGSLSADTDSVPILNFLGRSQAAGAQDEAEVEPSSEASAQKEGFARGPLAEAWYGRRPLLSIGKRYIPHGEVVRPFTRQEIDSSDGGTTLTGSLPFEKSYPPERGYETRVEGYFGAPQDSAGQALTQPLQKVDHSKPLARDQDDAKKAAALKPSPLEDQSPMPFQETGEVGFTWADTPV